MLSSRYCHHLGRGIPILLEFLKTDRNSGLAIEALERFRPFSRLWKSAALFSGALALARLIYGDVAVSCRVCDGYRSLVVQPYDIRLLSLSDAFFSTIQAIAFVGFAAAGLLVSLRGASAAGRLDFPDKDRRGKTIVTHTVFFGACASYLLAWWEYGMPILRALGRTGPIFMSALAFVSGIVFLCISLFVAKRTASNRS